MMLFADLIGSSLGTCEMAGGCGGGCSGNWKIFNEEWRILFCLGSIGVL